MARKPTKLTENMLAILAVMPDDGSPLFQSEIYQRLGYAEGVGSVLYAMRRRGLIELVDTSCWQKTLTKPQ